MAREGYSTASVEADHTFPEGICVLTYDKLHPESVARNVEDNAAGAITLFIGTTRSSFKGKIVTRLEYQAYSSLALRTMTDIIKNSRTKAVGGSSVIRCAIYHRLGVVPVGEASIVIAVSSPHRREAFSTSEWILEEVKAKAQIWKREFYEGEDESTALWKDNRT